MAGLIDAGKVTPRTRLKVPSELDRDGRVINDWFPHEELRLTLAGVIAKSSNIGTVRAADEFGKGELRRYLARFGLGAPPRSGSAARSPASSRPPACGTGSPRTASPSASRCRSTPSR